MAWNLHAIEQMQLLGRLKFDFHTGLVLGLFVFFFLAVIVLRPWLLTPRGDDLEA